MARTPKSSGQLRRHAASRQQAKRILVVCEDSKSSINYFQGLVGHLQIQKDLAEIIFAHQNSAPSSVVEHAVIKYIEAMKAKRPFDAVFCVFDRDSHATYFSAIATVNGLRASGLKDYPAIKDAIRVITTNPCFELWILLHYGYSTKQYARAGTASPCDCAVSDLQQNPIHAGYAKGNANAYQGTYRLLSAAMTNAQHLVEFHENSSAGMPISQTNPHTLIHLLVQYLFDNCLPKPT